MPAYLSPEWLSAFADALSTEAPAEIAGSEADCLVRQQVTETPFGTVTYDVALADGRITVNLTPDAATVPDIVLSLAYDTAAAIAQGRLTAQEGISAGRIAVRGELARIVAARAVLGAIADRARKLRADTTYDSSL